MIRKLTLLVLLISSVLAVSAEQLFAQLQAEYLRCEYRVDPLGIDEEAPRLSWTLTGEERGQRQTAYQVLVASSVAALDSDNGDIWDSGQVASDNMSLVEYAGSELSSGTEYYWKVRVWDKDSVAGSWSATAKWSMGMLSGNDWQAKWVGYDPVETQPYTPEILSSTYWIWSDGNAANGTAVGTRYFRRSFDIPAQWQIDSAICYITADDNYTLYVNGNEVVSGDTHTVINKADIEGFLQAGKNVLAVRAANLGDSDNPAGLLAALTIKTVTGETLEIASDNLWLRSTNEFSGWQSVDFNDSSWIQASYLIQYGLMPWTGTALKYLPPVRYIRHEYQLQDKAVKSAKMYVSAMGIYNVYMNGERVTDDYFSPGWTDYPKRIYYRTYDITDSLQNGDNAIAAQLADGWYAGYVGFAGERNHYGKDLRLLCQLEIEYTDGTKQVVASGPDWKASLGPIQYGDFLQGENYDARKELTGWDNPGYSDSDWSPVVVGNTEISPVVQAAVSQPVVCFAEVNPIEITEPVPGHYIFNMGQNFAGVVRLKVEGERGQRIQLRHAERLNNDGTMYTTNLRTADARDIYVCKGEGVETWQPYFTFHGFQYVEVVGLDSRPSLDMITGLAFSSDTPLVGTFECSDPMVNKIQQNSLWTQRMNFIDIPTDCPQRDERLGWTGDAQVYINTACYHTDVEAFFTKWMRDLTDGQRADGQFPTVAPMKISTDDGGPAWADAGVICPWTIYKMYGDVRILADNYNAMKRFIAFNADRCKEGYLPPDNFHCFGDWLNINDSVSNDVVYIAYLGYSTKLMIQIADVLGYADDAAYYQQMFDQIKATFKATYVDVDGKIYGDNQCGYVMAIAYDLLDEADTQKAAGHLVRRIKECNWHLSTGFVGTKDLMLALAKIGRNDIAYRLLLNDTFPSWGYTIKNGATSIWERWNGWTPENGFNDPGMNSFAHYSFGAVCQWIFENIGGIQTDGPGFKHIVLKPSPNNSLSWAKTSYRSIQGSIKSDWTLKGTNFSCQVTVPTGTTAVIYIPADSSSSVMESGVPAAEAECVEYAGYEDGCAVYYISSGTYSFESSIKWSVSLWRNDAESQISVGKSYTHKVNLHTAEPGTTLVNGVAFENDNNRGGGSWSLTGAPLTHSSTGAAIAGESGKLVSDFFMGSLLSWPLVG